MIVRKLAEIRGGESDVHAKTWNSRRLLLKRDGMGFSLHDTIIFPGTETRMCYRHHLEAVYCIEGDGSVEVVGGPRWPISAGTMYALDSHEEHVLRAKTRLRLICVFNPPVTGQEIHGPDGAYPADEEKAAG